MKRLVETGMKPASFTTMFADNPNINDQEREALRRRSSSMVRTNPWDIWREELRLIQGQLPIGGSPTTHRSSIHLLRCDQEGQNLFRIVDAGESRPTAARSTYGTT
jgi:hypothetical protein